MILIDSVYINQGGGLVLLKRILETLTPKQRSVSDLLLDQRVRDLFNDKSYFPSGLADFNSVEYLTGNYMGRWKWYRKNQRKYTTVFSLSNVPPPFGVKGQTIYTYCHQLFMFDRSMLDTSMKFRQWIRTQVIKIHFRKSKSQVIVQTQSMAQRFIDQWGFKTENVHQFPVFHLPNVPEVQTDKHNAITCLTYIYDYKGHYDLLEAIADLPEAIQKRVQLTLERDQLDASKVDATVLNNISFLGQMAHSDVMKEVANSAFVVHPSKAESFGLVLLECASLQVPIVCPDLPYVSDVISGAYIYKNNDIESLLETINQVSAKEKREFPKAIIKDQTQELVQFLLNDKIN